MDLTMSPAGPQKQFGTRIVSPASNGAHRSRSLRVLFLQGDGGTVERCTEVLRKAQFTVSVDAAETTTECAERLHAQAYDVVIAGYPSHTLEGLKDLAQLCKSAQDTPLLYLTNTHGGESAPDPAAYDVFECVERERIAELPATIRHAMSARKFRAELQEAGRALQYTKSLYRALVENPGYAVFGCDAKGKIVDINEAFLSMMGYSSKAEFLAATDAEVVMSFGLGSLVETHTAEAVHIKPVEVAWRRKNGTILKARLSGGAVKDEDGRPSGYEMIAVDITEQREMEEHLRREASKDSLTGLANHRQLFNVLHAEIRRSERTGRAFALLLLDLDGLKEINGRFGHLTGDRALCRLAMVLMDRSRSTDTAARQGGDEFCMVLPETDVAAAKMMASRIGEVLAKDGEEPALSVSIGVASFPQDGDTVSELITAADRALYTMKSTRSESERAG
jgi:diguanylate cyclase (GGDEF)-like protein/PAS domain S-box-containing protein